MAEGRFSLRVGALGARRLNLWFASSKAGINVRSGIGIPLALSTAQSARRKNIALRDWSSTLTVVTAPGADIHVRWHTAFLQRQHSLSRRESTILKDNLAGPVADGHSSGGINSNAEICCLHVQSF